jgi:hypothetical protein
MEPHLRGSGALQLIELNARRDGGGTEFCGRVTRGETTVIGYPIFKVFYGTLGVDGRPVIEAPHSDGHLGQILWKCSGKGLGNF